MSGIMSHAFMTKGGWALDALGTKLCLSDAKTWRVPRNKQFLPLLYKPVS